MESTLQRVTVNTQTREALTQDEIDNRNAAQANVEVPEAQIVDADVLNAEMQAASASFGENQRQAEIAIMTRRFDEASQMSNEAHAAGDEAEAKKWADIAGRLHESIFAQAEMNNLADRIDAENGVTDGGVREMQAELEHLEANGVFNSKYGFER